MEEEEEREAEAADGFKWQRTPSILLLLLLFLVHLPGSCALFLVCLCDLVIDRSVPAAAFCSPLFFISCIVIDSYDALISTWPRTNQPTNQQTNNIETFFQHNQREIRVRQNSSSSSSSSFLCIFKIIIRKDWPLHPVTWPDTWRTQQNKFKIDDGEERNEKRKRKGDNWFKDTRSVGEKCVRLFVWENPGAAWLDVRTYVRVTRSASVGRAEATTDCARMHTHISNRK